MEGRFFAGTLRVRLEPDRVAAQVRQAYSDVPRNCDEYPACLAHAAAAAGPNWDAMSNEGKTMPCRILLADDNADTLESLAMLLSLDGHSVYTASNGEQTLERAEQHQPDVALVDIGMPGMDGYEVARRIRAEPWGARIMLVAVTGWSPDSHGNSSKDAGFDSHLVKPVDLQQLSALLARAAQRPRR